MWKSLLTLMVFTSFLGAAELSERFAKKVGSIEETYKSAVQKADNTRFYAVQKASQERNKALKAALVEATKAGDFDAATEIKARINADSLAIVIAGTEWQAAPNSDWGRFVFNGDGTLTVERSKGIRRWYPIDENSVLMTGQFDATFVVGRFMFNEERTSATIYSLGAQKAPEWDAKRLKPSK